MRYLRQFSIILFISLIGEIIHLFISLPIPASIYGLLLMLIGLKTKLIPLNAVEDASMFLIEIMPVMFIPAAVGLLDSWGVLGSMLVPFIVITLVSTILVMVTTGRVTQFFIRVDKKGKDDDHE
uniref:CidA/LrgA family protein n=1 Tax=Clostridium sp. 12(A) TaxID=1163671 RepID=UPI000466D802|nr:CidA/LrgA family protein [Clostridium sp. 12(A)]